MQTYTVAKEQAGADAVSALTNKQSTNPALHIQDKDYEIDSIRGTAHLEAVLKLLKPSKHYANHAYINESLRTPWQ